MGKTVGNQGQKLVWCHVSVLRCCRAAGAEVLVQEVLSAGVPHTADVLQVIWVLRVHGATNPSGSTTPTSTSAPAAPAAPAAPCTLHP